MKKKIVKNMWYDEDNSLHIIDENGEHIKYTNVMLQEVKEVKNTYEDKTTELVEELIFEANKRGDDFKPWSELFNHGV